MKGFSQIALLFASELFNLLITSECGRAIGHRIMNKMKLFTLPPSPYNTKVRLALKLKGLDFETVAVDGFDGREEIIEASGQPLTPVLMDGDRAVYDSFGILRYLDANFPGTKLYSADRASQQKIQEWERFGYQLSAPLGMVAGQAFSGEIDDQQSAEAQVQLDTVPQILEDALANTPYLMGDAPTAADLSLVPFLRYTVEDPKTMPEGTPMRFVAERLRLGSHFPKTQAWVERVMELDKEVVAS